MNETKVWEVNERNMLWNRLRIENAGNIRIEIEDF
jgi:hypothetical protein